MKDPLNRKLKALIYTSSALALALVMASGFQWVTGGQAAETSAAATPVATSATFAPADEAQVVATADMQVLSQVNQALMSVAQSVTPAVVSIDTRGTPSRRAHPQLPEPFDEFFRRFQQPEGEEETPFDVPLGRGSGFIVSEDGYILTNNHVVATAEKITVELSNGQQFDAELVGRDPTTDVAVIKIPGGDLPTLSLGKSDEAHVGELVLAIGNPGLEFGSSLPFTVTSGIISAKGRNLGIIQRAAENSRYAIEDLIQTDAVINPGNSGGPLVNTEGRVIGINTAIASLTGYYQGYGFAIPINLARNVMEDLIEYGRVRRAALGVQITRVTSGDVEAFRLPGPKGAVVQDFTDDSPAREAGMERGDVIVAVDGKPVERVGQLQNLIASYDPGATVDITVVRYGKERTFEVKLTEAPVPQPTMAERSDVDRPAASRLGFSVQPVTPQLTSRAGFPEDADLEGVFVSSIARFGPAAAAGLRPGWIITHVENREVRDMSDFEEAVEDLEPGSVVSVRGVAPQDGSLAHRIFNIEVPSE